MVTVGFGNWEIIADILLGMEFCQWCVDDEMDSLVCDTIISVVFLFYVTVRSYVVFSFSFSISFYLFSSLHFIYLSSTLEVNIPTLKCSSQRPQDSDTLFFLPVDALFLYPSCLFLYFLC